MASDFGFKASTGNDYYFVSYNTEDTDRVSAICNQLHKEGLELWYDEGIPQDSYWESVIAEKIDNSKETIFFITKGIFEKGRKRQLHEIYTYKEYDLAKRYKKKTLIVTLDELDDKEDIPYLLMPWWQEIDPNVKQGIISVGESPQATARKIMKALGWKKDRYSIYDEIDYPMFNSLNDHPTIGEERRFVHVRQAGETSWKRVIDVIPGRQYEVEIRYRNDASEKYNSSKYDCKGVARGTAVSVDLPVHASIDYPLAVRIFAENARSECSDAILLRSSDGSQPSINYVNKSAVIHNSGMANGSVLPTSLFSFKGALIGTDALNGVVPGGDRDSGYIRFAFTAEKRDSEKKSGQERKRDSEQRTWQEKTRDSEQRSGQERAREPEEKSGRVRMSNNFNTIYGMKFDQTGSTTQKQGTSRVYYGKPEDRDPRSGPSRPASSTGYAAGGAGTGAGAGGARMNTGAGTGAASAYSSQATSGAGAGAGAAYGNPGVRGTSTNVNQGTGTSGARVTHGTGTAMPSGGSAGGKTGGGKTAGKMNPLAWIMIGVMILVIMMAVYSSTRKPEPKTHTHVWQEATYDQPKTCKECGATEGEVKGYVGTITLNVSEDKDKLGTWDVSVHELETPLKEFRWIDLGLTVSETRGFDLPAKFHIYYRSNGEWKYCWTVNVDELDKEYRSKYSDAEDEDDPAGDTVEALAVVPDIETEEEAGFTYTLKAYAAQVEE